METKQSLQHEVENLMKRAYEARINNPLLSIELAEQAINLCKDNDESLHAKVLSQLGLFQMIKGDFQAATEFSNKALLHFQKVNDLKGIADTKYTIGSVHYKTDNFHTGLQYLLDSLQLYRKLDDKHNEARVLKAIGTIYEYFGDQENAINSYLKCIKAAEAVNDQNQISNAYNPLSGIYLKQGLHDLALSIIQKSIAIKEKTQDLRGLAFALYGRGKVYLKLQLHTEALEDFTRSLEMQKEMGDKLGEGMVYNKLGSLYMAKRYYDKAEKYFLNAMNVAQEYNIQFIKFKAHYNLYLLACEQKDTYKALRYLEKYTALKEAVINTRTYDIIKSYESLARIETLEREAKAQKDKAAIIEKKNSELDSFFYRISHDLKGPISSLQGLFNLVKLEVRDPLALNYFEMCQNQIHRINNIIIDLIDITRMNHPEGYRGKAKSKIDFNVLVKECILSYSYIADFKKIKFVTEIDTDIEYYAEWAIVNTILQNLIENSIKYVRTDTDPYVGVFVKKENDIIKIQVEDNGQGILPTYQSKIFDMFFRANEKSQGTGLGLYILKRAVEKLNGEITFKSEVNVGSTFTITLPVSKVN